MPSLIRVCPENANPRLELLNDGGGNFRGWQRCMLLGRRGNNLRTAPLYCLLWHRYLLGHGQWGYRRRDNHPQATVPHHSHRTSATAFPDRRRNPTSSITNIPRPLPSGLNIPSVGVLSPPPRPTSLSTLVSAHGAGTRYGPMSAADANPSARQPGTV